MSEKEIERAAYIAAHRILSANTAPVGLVCPGARRSYAVDTIAGIIRDIFEVSEPGRDAYTNRADRRIQTALQVVNRNTTVLRQLPPPRAS